MNRIAKVLLAVSLLLAAATTAFAQYVPNSPPQNAAASATVGPGGLVTTVSGFTVAVSPGPIYCLGDIGILTNTQFTLFASQTYQIAYSCLTDQIYARTGPAIQGADILLATVVTNASGIASVTDLRTAIQFPNAADGTYIIPPNDGCAIAVGASGTFAAPVLTGAGNGGSNPGPFRTAAGSWVLQSVTTGAASIQALTCDLTPPSKLTTGKGVIINNVQLFYGVQTTALTSITAPTIQTLTYPATGAAAGLTNAAAGGALTVTPGALQLTTTTSGQCFSENISLGTPVLVNTDLQRVTLDQLFNQAGAAAQTLQICGVIVHYTNVPL